MNRKRWIVGGAAALAAALFVVASARATPEIAKLERKKCMDCHTRIKGGKDHLNGTGMHYQEFRKFPVPGPMVHPKPAKGTAPQEAWHPARSPARVPVRPTRTDQENERQLKARMARWTRSLGAKSCYTCHAEKLPGATVTQLRESRRKYEVARRHAEMTDMINRSLGASKVSCYTCHLGGRGPVTMP